MEDFLYLIRVSMWTVHACMRSKDEMKQNARYDGLLLSICAEIASLLAYEIEYQYMYTMFLLGCL